MAKKQTPEGALLRQTLDYLAANRIFSIRMNTGAVKTADRFFRFGVPGMADVLVFKGQLFEWKDKDGGGGFPFQEPIWLELKSPKGVQSALQKSFQAQVEAEGHRYVVIRSFEDLQKTLS